MGVLLLLMLTACRKVEPVAIYKPGTPVPTDLPLSTPTAPRLDQDQDTPSPAEPTPLGEEICLQKAGNIEAYEITWQDRTLEGSIYTPPCYPASDQRYPVLYLLHGATQTDRQWLDLGLDKLADDLIIREEIPPVIIVLPREDTWLSPPENPFGDDLVQVVIPWVDQTYQTRAEREYRAVGGLSRGGNWAVRLGLLHWSIFGSLGGHSTPLFFGDLNRLPGWLEVIPADSFPRIYLDIGEADPNLVQAESLQEILVDAGISPEWQVNPGLHDEKYWRSHLDEYLLWYSARWGD